MINFERERLEYILQKETQVKTKESNIKVIEDCSNKNDQLTNALASINKILNNIGLKDANDINNTTNTTNDKNNNIIKGIKNVITGEIDPNIVADPDKNLKNCSSENNTNNTNNLKDNIDTEINTEISDQVPMEYIINTSSN